VSAAVVPSTIHPPPAGVTVSTAILGVGAVGSSLMVPWLQPAPARVSSATTNKPVSNLIAADHIHVACRLAWRKVTVSPLVAGPRIARHGEDQTYGNRVNAGAAVAIAHRSGWAFEWHADRTFNLEPPRAPCGLVNVTCIGVAHDGPTKMVVTSLNVRRYFGAGRTQPFLTGGVGVMWSRSLHSVTHVRGSTATISEFATSARGFGPDLGAGVRIRLAPSWSMETAVRWLDAPWLSRHNLAVTRVLTGAVYARQTK
jgi:opacity protein-like surface antigen